jgi:hypothetical protein
MNPIRKLIDVTGSGDEHKSFTALVLLTAVAVGSFFVLMALAEAIYPPAMAIVVGALIVALYRWTTA